MVERDTICYQITSPISVSGERMVMVAFGKKIDSLKHATQQGPIPWDNDALIIMSEGEWKELNPKFVVGEKYKLCFEKGGVAIRK
ncbi:MAG: hypothetical protein ACP5O3_02880 [Candidatus Micrarchaeia archaeon]|jgi:hypothetical protein